MTKVTLKEMCDQLEKISPSRLDFNVANFATEVGNIQKEYSKNRSIHKVLMARHGNQGNLGGANGSRTLS